MYVCRYMRTYIYTRVCVYSIYMPMTNNTHIDKNSGRVTNVTGLMQLSIRKDMLYPFLNYFNSLSLISDHLLLLDSKIKGIRIEF